MASSLLSAAALKTERQVYENPDEEEQISVGGHVGVCGVVHRRIQDIFWNYMVLQAQIGLYGGGDYDDL